MKAELARDRVGSVVPAAVASGALVAQTVAGKATRDTLFLGHFGLELLPAAMIAAAVLSLVAAAFTGRALARTSPARVLPVSFAISVALFLLEWWLSTSYERLAAAVVYAHSAIFWSASMSAFWSLVNETYDPHTAKRVVGRIASGGTLGGVLAGLVVWAAARRISVPTMLALLAGINALGLWGALRMRPPEGRGAAAPRREAGPQSTRATEVLGVRPYLRDLALLVLGAATMQALLDWLLSAEASNACGTGAPLLAFFALFNTFVGALAFIAQAGLSRWLLEKMGLGGTVKVAPASLAVAVSVALVAPSFAAVIVLRAVDAVAKGSFFRAAYELFYTPLPPREKRATKTLIDVGVDRIGTAIGSIGLLALVRFMPFSGTPSAAVIRVVLALTLALAAFAWVVATRLQKGYVSALASSLKSGLVKLAADDAHDMTTRRTLAETTAQLDREKLLEGISRFEKERGARRVASVVPDPPRASPGETSPELARDPLVLRAAALRSGDLAQMRSALSSPLPTELAAFVLPLLENDAVARDAVRALRKIAPKATGLLLDHLVDTNVDPRIRRRIPRVLEACRSQRTADGLLSALRDPQFEVRAQAAATLVRFRTDEQIRFDPQAVIEIALHELTAGRETWPATRTLPPVDDDDAHGQALDEPPVSRRTPELDRGLAHVFTLLGLILEREPLAIAYKAVRLEDPSMRGTATEYLEVVLPPRVRELLTPILGEGAPRAGDHALRKPPRDRRTLADELLRSQAR